jgi:hypothetical protein
MPCEDGRWGRPRPRTRRRRPTTSGGPHVGCEVGPRLPRCTGCRVVGRGQELHHLPPHPSLVLLTLRLMALMVAVFLVFLTYIHPRPRAPRRRRHRRRRHCRRRHCCHRRHPRRPRERPVPRRRVLGIRELSFLHGAGGGLFGRRGGPPRRPDAPESPASYSASVEESAALRARPLPLPLRGPPMCEPTRFAGISSSFLLGAIECESLRVSKMLRLGWGGRESGNGCMGT